MATVTVKGVGGSTWDEDLAPAGSPRRELFDAMVERGDLTVVDDPDGTLDPDPEPTVDVSPDVPDGTVDEIVDWIRGGIPEPDYAADGWYERAHDALNAELDRDKPRKTLIDLLTDLLEV